MKEKSEFQISCMSNESKFVETVVNALNTTPGIKADIHIVPDNQVHVTGNKQQVFVGYNGTKMADKFRDQSIPVYHLPDDKLISAVNIANRIINDFANVEPTPTQIKPFRLGVLD